LYDADPRVTRQLLTAKVEEGGLMPGLVGPGEGPATAADPSSYDAGWLSPIERQRIAQAGGPSPAPSPAPAPAPSPTPAAPLGEVGVSAGVRTEGSGDDYDPNWLSGEERERITATREGRYTPDRVQFDEGVRPR